MIKSCVGCRRSKKKCDLKKPNCTRCQQFGLDCTYDSRVLAAIKPGEERTHFERQQIKLLNRKLNLLENIAKSIGLIKGEGKDAKLNKNALKPLNSKKLIGNSSNTKENEENSLYDYVDRGMGNFSPMATDTTSPSTASEHLGPSFRRSSSSITYSENPLYHVNEIEARKSNLVDYGFSTYKPGSLKRKISEQESKKITKIYLLRGIRSLESLLADYGFDLNPINIFFGLGKGTVFNQPSNLGITKSLNQDYLSSQMLHSYLQFRHGFYPFFSLKTLQTELDLQEFTKFNNLQSYFSPLLTCIQLLALRHSNAYQNSKDKSSSYKEFQERSKLLEVSGLKASGVSKNLLSSNYFSNMSDSKAPLPLESDPLYLQVDHLLRNNEQTFHHLNEFQVREGDYPLEFHLRLVSIQANLLVACLETAHLKLPRAQLRITTAAKFAQMLGIHDVDGNSVGGSFNFTPHQKAELKATWHMTILNDTMTSCFNSHPCITSPNLTLESVDAPMLSFPIEESCTVPPDQGIPISLDFIHPFTGTKIFSANVESFVMRHMVRLAEIGSVLYTFHHTLGRFMKQDLSLQNLEINLLSMLDRIDRAYPDNNCTHLIATTKVEVSPTAMLEYLLVMVKSLLVIDICDPLIDAFVTSGMITPNLQNYRDRLYLAARRIAFLLDENDPEKGTMSTRPHFWFAREFADWTIPLAAFHSIKALFKIRLHYPKHQPLPEQIKSEVLDLDLITRSARRVYAHHANAWPVCSSIVDFVRFSGWDAELSRKAD